MHLYFYLKFHVIRYLFVFDFFFIVSTSLSQADLKPAAQWSMNLNFLFPCFHFLSTEIIGMCLYIILRSVGSQSQGFVHVRQELYQLSHSPTPFPLS